MKKQRLLKIVQPVLSAESGRSMVEMLGVLAIIGVLSIGAVAGYKFALNKFRANEIINELNARALSVSAQMLSTTTPYESDEVIEDGFGNTLAVGYSAESAVSSQNPEYFEITINGIPSEVCTQILRDYENPIMIFVNEVRYNNDINLCTTESGTVDMGFIYRRDLGERETCSEKGYFGEEDFICHCAGNTYIDPNNPNECLCPAGTIWSAESGEHGECIESICEEGYFESATNGCVPCSDEAMYTLSGSTLQSQICKACDNRNVGYFNTLYYCYNMENPACTPKEQYRDKTGQCVDCFKSDYHTLIFKTDDSHALCDACPNRYTQIHAGTPIHSSCFLKECTSDNQFLGSDKCYDCNTSSSVSINNNDIMKNSCKACKNNLDVNNRSVIQKGSSYYCTKTVCDSNEFMGTDGQCYSCTDPKKIAVNVNSGCTNTACNRIEVINENGTTYCQIANCPSDGTYSNAFGNCYKCTGGSVFASTKSQCDQCTSPKRLWIGTDNADGTAGGSCMPLCDMGTEVPYGTSYCTYCPTTTYPAGTNAVHYEYCNNCETPHHIVKGWCVNDNACTKGTHFINASMSYSICSACEITEKVNIGSHENERKYCLMCTSAKRFWAGEYCYRCDTSETPDVLSDTEEDSCISCSEREVKDGKCVLKQ